MQSAKDSKIVLGCSAWNASTPYQFHPGQLKNVPENETKRFCFALTLWPQGKVKVCESGIKWWSQWCLKAWQVWKKNFFEKFGYNVYIFAMQDGRPANQLQQSVNLPVLKWSKDLLCPTAKQRQPMKQLQYRVITMPKLWNTRGQHPPAGECSLSHNL